MPMAGATDITERVCEMRNIAVSASLRLSTRCLLVEDVDRTTASAFDAPPVPNAFAVKFA